ncbi:heavy-metal-associated domain-containing protein [Sandaracinus amylolyticus]|uniref:heavy-metal-associated domain-containing protein n=1 Tax=Sandaracinus amylolyticus TaxID=927083 RepID=UPI001F2EF652|nr:heavy-metal-associated domain-containing protein [Sandaracinus amylolyticus]UJR84350.1 Hypothetical protein I5071_64290 [Sandaracinus amylolyticus]
MTESTNRETRLRVAGMTCMSCVRHVDHALRDLDGVAAVQVRFREGEALVQHDPARATIDEMIGALRDAGYDAALAA